MRECQFEPPVLSAVVSPEVSKIARPQAERSTHRWWKNIPLLGLVLRWLGALASGIHWLFGVATLILGLATLASLPVLQLLSMGYLLEVSGRIARTGRFRAGFIGIRHAARIGGIVLGTWLLLLIPLFLARLYYVARLIDPVGARTRTLGVMLFVVSGLLVSQIVWAWYRGGRLRDFFWPAPLRLWREFRRPGNYGRARDAVWDFVSELRLPYYFWLGLRGFAGTVAILFLPISLFVATVAVAAPGGILIVLLGGLFLSAVLMYLPFLQAHFAAEGRLRALFEWSRIRNMFRRAPWAFFFALLFTLASALPLYLLKIEWTPRELAALIGTVFVVFMFPARLFSGFAIARAHRRSADRAWWSCWLARFLCLPAAIAYVFFLFFFRFFLWNGHFGLFEQHAFLLPIPFLGW